MNEQTGQLIQDCQDLLVRRQVERDIEDIAHDASVTGALHSAFGRCGKPVPSCECADCAAIRQARLDALELEMTNRMLGAAYQAMDAPRPSRCDCGCSRFKCPTRKGERVRYDALTQRILLHEETDNA